MGEKIKDYILKLWLLVSFLLVAVLISFIFIYIFKKGIGSLSLDFIFASPKGRPVGSEGGIFPAIVGSLYLSIIACVFASILALATSIYNTFYCKSKYIKNIIHLIVQSMAGIPSIVLGLFGYTFLVVYLGLGRSLLAGAVTLGLMIYPYIQIKTEETLQQVPGDIIKSSYALGVSKSYTIVKIILPYTKVELASTITMAGGFAMGASAPIMLTAAVMSAPLPKSLSSPVMALPFHLYMLTSEGISLDKAYGTALVLVIILLVINFFLVFLEIKKKRG